MAAKDRAQRKLVVLQEASSSDYRPSHSPQDMAAAELSAQDYEDFERICTVESDSESGHVFQKKIDNYFLNRQEFGELVIRSTPIRLYLEATYKCNLKCPHCSRSEADIKGRQTDADMEMYKATSNLVERAIEVQMHGLGEPFLARNFEEQMRFIVDRGATPFACTNGQKLYPDKLRLMAEQFGSIAFSVDSLNQENGEILRPGMKVEKLFAAMDCVAKLREEFPKLPLFVFTVTTTFLRTDWGPLLDRLRDYGPLGWVMIPFEHTGDEELDKVGLSMEDHLSLIDEIRAASKDTGVWVLSGFPNEEGYCYEPWSRAFIGSNGDVRPCCRAPEDLVMGNLKKQPFEEIWNNERYQDLRSTVNTEKAWPICADCKYRNFSANFPPPSHIVKWKLEQSREQDEREDAPPLAVAPDSDS